MSLPSTPRMYRTCGALCASLLIGALLLVGCGNSNSNPTESSDDLSYEVGPPLEDSSHAVIVTSSFGADTLITPVFRQQMNQLMQRFSQGNPNNPRLEEIRRGIVENFVTRHVLAGEAERQNVEADTAQVNAQVRRFRSQFQDPRGFQQWLAMQGLTEDSLRSLFTEQVRVRTMQQQLAEEIDEPTGEEVESFRQEQAEQVRAQHILFRTQGGNSDSVRQEAQAVLDSAKSGTNFGDLAQRHSDDGTASRGGDLGYFSRGQMVPPFEEAAFALPDSGAITPELVETQYGYHIIRLTGRRTVEAMDSSRARSMMEQQRGQEALEEGLDRLRAEATVRINPDIVQVDLNES